ncbi:MAG: YihA family ribosome biogenesis GTP-binding protein [Clostridiaceae bacterium]|jgi:GTP-binding protein|nr:YihA family ribosome biogenesis GTP-binding protein [Clostridiaceae bacterium]
MVIKKAEIIISAVEPSQYPNTGWPEIALAGRSNVGKSSLINALVNRKALARVGNTPGKTRIINFYNINDSISLVDLPGYGYAKVSREEKMSWGRLAETYLNSRKNLNMILLLVDIRHDPTPDDVIMMNYIKETGRDYAVIATKADKIKRSEYKKHIDRIRAVLELDNEHKIIAFSSLKRMGIDEVWSKIETVLE